MLDPYDNARDSWFEHATDDALGDRHDGDRLCCVRCRRVLTTRAYAARIAGRGSHVHTNPAGFTYRMRTFSDAPGCRAEGAPQREHSWFPPHAWQIASCHGCGGHVGWRFSAAGGAVFFALIADRLCADGAA